MFCSFLVTESDLPSDVRRGLTEINRTKEKLSEKSKEGFADFRQKKKKCLREKSRSLHVTPRLSVINSWIYDFVRVKSVDFQARTYVESLSGGDLTSL